MKTLTAKDIPAVVADEVQYSAIIRQRRESDGCTETTVRLPKNLRFDVRLSDAAPSVVDCGDIAWNCDDEIQGGSTTASIGPIVAVLVESCGECHRYELQHQ